MDLTLKQRVGNIKTNRIGTIVSDQFRGANGEFRGYVIAVDGGTNEIWDFSVISALPAGF